jgi:hypothetical protein
MRPVRRILALLVVTFLSAETLLPGVLTLPCAVSPTHACCPQRQTGADEQTVSAARPGCCALMAFAADDRRDEPTQPPAATHIIGAPLLQRSVLTPALAAAEQSPPAFLRFPPARPLDPPVALRI